MDLWIYIAVWIAVWLACGIASLLVARNRGVMNGTPWFFVGMLLGPFGLILTFMDARPQKPEYTMEALNYLRELRDQGALTGEDYEERRRELLGGDVIPGRRS